MNTTELIDIVREQHPNAYQMYGHYPFTVKQLLHIVQRIERQLLDRMAGKDEQISDNGLEIINLREQIAQLREALQNLRDVASQCDSWESFPSSALDAADKVLEETK